MKNKQLHRDKINILLNKLMLDKIKKQKEAAFFVSIFNQVVELSSINDRTIRVIEVFAENIKGFCEDEMDQIKQKKIASLVETGKQSIILPVMNQCINLLNQLETEQKQFVKKQNEIFCSFKY